MPVHCAQCGIQSTLDTAYAVDYSWLGRKRFCPCCWRDIHERRARAGLVLVVLLAIGAFGLFAIGGSAAGQAGAWLAFNACLYVVFVEAATFAHELGHALAAHALGFRVFSITTGLGPVLLERTVNGVSVRLRAFPFGGVTVCLPRDRQLFRLKYSLVVAAGPAVNGLVAACVLMAGTELDLVNIIDAPSPSQMLLAANAMALVVSLLPMKTTSATGVASSDGLALVTIPFMGRARVTEALAARYVLEAHYSSERDALNEALAWADQGLDEFPGTPSLHASRGFTLVLLGDCQGARREYMAVAAATNVEPTLRALAINNIAWVDAVTDPNDRLDEADRLSQEALGGLGFMPAIKGTRGTVLVALGRLDEGIGLLRNALQEARDDELHPMARATYSSALALALVQQGRAAEAAELLPAARGYHGRSPLLGRVERAIADASERDAAVG